MWTCHAGIHPRGVIGNSTKRDYDLIIASNTLHATPYLTETLRHTRTFQRHIFPGVGVRYEWCFYGWNS